LTETKHNYESTILCGVFAVAGRGHESAATSSRTAHQRTARSSQCSSICFCPVHPYTQMDDGTLPLSLTDDGLRQLFGDDTQECLEQPNTFPTDLELDAMNDTIMRTIREDDGGYTSVFSRKEENFPEETTDENEDSIHKPKPKPKPECQKCCKIGAYAGKKYRRKVCKK
jgi:hypothetical protein